MDGREEKRREGRERRERRGEKKKRKHRDGAFLEELAWGSAYVPTMCCIVTNSSDRAAAGF